ncbi:MAG: protein jag [Deltaproteobacteria bacterium]|nr:MAG: protein jag [Deltaproteobacteria bacterium]
MKSIETEGDTIDEAIERALNALQVGRDRVEIEILADASRGLFGFGGKKARVRATVRPPLSALGGERLIDADSRETSRSSTSTRDGRSDRSGSSRASRPRGPTPGPVHPPTEAMAPPAGPFQARAKAVLEGILAYLTAGCAVEARTGDEPGTLVLAVKGDSGGLVIGRRGQTLDALEYLVNRIVARSEDAPASRIMVDVEGYRERRREYLNELARRLAEKAKQTGRSVTLNPMSPRDRRVVHLALQNDTSVETRSQGQGYYRKMLILPGARRGNRPSPPSQE